MARHVSVIALIVIAEACAKPETAPRALVASASPIATQEQSVPPTPRPVSTGVLEPKLLSGAPPKFPRSTIPRRIKSSVYLFEAVVNETGVVGSVRTLKKADISPEWPELEEACRRSVLSWRYEPAVHQGKAVPAYLTVSVLVDWQ